MRIRNLAHHKNKVVSCGRILSSFVEKLNDGICRESTPVTVQKTRQRVKVDVALCLQAPNCSWNSWAARRGPTIRKVVLGREKVEISQVATELSRFYSLHGKRLVAACMQINGQSRHHESWTNPLMSEGLARMQQALDRASQADGNQSAKKFWMKSLLLEELDVGLSFDTLKNEVENFRRPFELS